MIPVIASRPGGEAEMIRAIKSVLAAGLLTTVLWVSSAGAEAAGDEDDFLGLALAVDALLP